MSTKDHLYECNDKKLPAVEFMQIFCNRCRNSACQRAGWGKSVFQNRVSTQVERLLENPKYADMGNPKYAQIRAIDFPDMLQKALRLEISDRKGDWCIPEIAVTDGVVEKAKGQTTDSVDEAIKKLAEAKGNEAPDLPDRHEAEQEKFDQETETIMVKNEATEDPPRPPGKVVNMNTPVPSEGIMLGEPVEKKTESDPWAVPTKEDTLVEPGAKIRMGLAKIKDGE